MGRQTGAHIQMARGRRAGRFRRLQGRQRRAAAGDRYLWRRPEACGRKVRRLGQHPERHRQSLEQAVTAYEDALTVKTRDHDARDWAGMTSNMAVALMYLGEREQRTDKLDAARQAFVDALDAMDKAAQPLDWGHLQGNFGSVL